jgi:RNA polymerase sigma-70 factor (ECF subfamily)
MTIDDFNNIVDLYADSLYRFILKNIKNKEKAEDIVQESFEQLWKNAHKLDVSKAKSYLFTTAYHKLIDTVKKDKRIIIGDIENEKTVTPNESPDLQNILHKAIDKLPTIQKAVLLLRDYEGYSYKEIEQITGLSESQVKVYIFRARHFLKEYLGKIDILI